MLSLHKSRSLSDLRINSDGSNVRGSTDQPRHWSPRELAIGICSGGLPVLEWRSTAGVPKWNTTFFFNWSGLYEVIHDEKARQVIRFRLVWSEVWEAMFSFHFTVLFTYFFKRPAQCTRLLGYKSYQNGFPRYLKNCLLILLKSNLLIPIVKNSYH